MGDVLARERHSSNSSHKARPTSVAPGIPRRRARWREDGDVTTGGRRRRGQPRVPQTPRLGRAIYACGWKATATRCCALRSVARRWRCDDRMKALARWRGSYAHSCAESSAPNSAGSSAPSNAGSNAHNSVECSTPAALLRALATAIRAQDAKLQVSRAELGACRCRSRPECATTS